MIPRARRGVGAVVAVALAACVPGCTFAVDHPAVSAGVAGAAIGFGSCKLESDDYAACGVVGAGAGAALAVVAAVALWLGGDGHTVLVEEQAKPIPDDGVPVRAKPPAPPAIEPAPVPPSPPPDAAPLQAPASSP